MKSCAPSLPTTLFHPSLRKPFIRGITNNSCVMKWCPTLRNYILIFNLRYCKIFLHFESYKSINSFVNDENWTNNMVSRPARYSFTFEVKLMFHRDMRTFTPQKYEHYDSLHNQKCEKFPHH